MLQQTQIARMLCELELQLSFFPPVGRYPNLCPSPLKGTNPLAGSFGLKSHVAGRSTQPMLHLIVPGHAESSLPVILTVCYKYIFRYKYNIKSI